MGYSRGTFALSLWACSALAALITGCFDAGGGKTFSGDSNSDQAGLDLEDSRVPQDTGTESVSPDTGDTRAPDQDTPLETTPAIAPGTLMAFPVGPGGLAIQLPSAARLEVPAGAVLEEVWISVVEDNPPSVPDVEFVGLQYEFGPEGLFFEEPAKLVVPFVSTSSDDNYMLYTQAVDGSWDAMELYEDAEAGESWGWIYHFSKYVIGKSPPTCLIQPCTSAPICTSAITYKKKHCSSKLMCTTTEVKCAKGSVCLEGKCVTTCSKAVDCPKHGVSWCSDDETVMREKCKKFAEHTPHPLFNLRAVGFCIEEVVSNCELPFSCTSGQCSGCLPNCAYKDCGSSGCPGVSCPDLCGAFEVCNDATYKCDCTDPCGQRNCGTDACGNLCGSCIGSNAVCDSSTSICTTYDCTNKECGDGGGGHICGYCDQTNSVSGALYACVSGNGSNTCTCIPACEYYGRVCGPDGCGRSCGDCSAGKECTDGVCTDCIPTRSCQPVNGKQACGYAGCNTTCGGCGSGETCVAGYCTPSFCGDGVLNYDLGEDTCNCPDDSLSGEATGDYVEDCYAEGYLYSHDPSLCYPGCLAPEGKRLCTYGTSATYTYSYLCDEHQECGPPNIQVCQPEGGYQCGQQDCGWLEVPLYPGGPTWAARYCGDCSEAGQTCIWGRCSRFCPGSTTPCPATWQCQGSQCVCTPDCEDRECGSDGCTGYCGDLNGFCPQGLQCSNGQCICIGSCANKACGTDECGNPCGPMQGGCPEGLTCGQNGQCECEEAPCGDAECGYDGCGHPCGASNGGCPDELSCVEHECVECNPTCAGKTCGFDGCGNPCGDYQGDCFGEQQCINGVCQCMPSCSGLECGYDGCGQPCGSNAGECPAGEICTEGFCVCMPSCDQGYCGPDGCGGTCVCSGAGEACSGTQSCYYSPCARAWQCWQGVGLDQELSDSCAMSLGNYAYLWSSLKSCVDDACEGLEGNAWASCVSLAVATSDICFKEHSDCMAAQ